MKRTSQEKISESRNKMKLRFEEKSDRIFRQRILCGHPSRAVSDQAREVMDYLEQFFSCKSSGGDSLLKRMIDLVMVN